MGRGERPQRETKATGQSHADRRKRHLKQQALFDALRAVGAGETVWVTWEGRRLQLGPRPPITHPLGYRMESATGDALVFVGGRLRRCYVVAKNGLVAQWNTPEGPRWLNIQDDQIRALIVADHPRTPAVNP